MVIFYRVSYNILCKSGRFPRPDLLGSWEWFLRCPPRAVAWGARCFLQDWGESMQKMIEKMIQR